MPGPLRRSVDNRMLGGVAGGLSERIGLDATVVRIIIVLLTVGGGTGFVLYVLAWLVIPRAGSSAAIARRALENGRTVALALAFASVLVVSFLALQALGLTFAAKLVWPVSLGVAGLVVVWRDSDEEEHAFLRELVDQAPLVGPTERRGAPATIARVVLGVALVVVGLGGLVATRHPTFATVRELLAAGAVVAGFLVVFGPWWLRLGRDLADERRERVRSQERADMAATVHDSVLQTLALIQRSADDPREVLRLARAQERELRSWLFDGRAPGSFDGAEVTTLAQAMALVERDVESDHKVALDVVAVGDCPLDDEVGALLAAGREAIVNAAKWSGASTISVYVEVEPSHVSLFVRDRGVGFDPDAVPQGRRGISDSIRARVTRSGGTAVIRSAPGSGTEVELRMPRDDRT